jgi:hypothetical protein
VRILRLRAGHHWRGCVALSRVVLHASTEMHQPLCQ